MTLHATSKPFFSPEQVAAALAAAPDTVADDSDFPASPDWDNAIVSHSYAELKEKLAARKAGGRPKSAAPKESLTLRYSPDVLAAFRATGKGWQTRINAALTDWLKTHSPGEIA